MTIEDQVNREDIVIDNNCDDDDNNDNGDIKDHGNGKNDENNDNDDNDKKRKHRVDHNINYNSNNSAVRVFRGTVGRKYKRTDTFIYNNNINDNYNNNDISSNNNDSINVIENHHHPNDNDDDDKNEINCDVFDREVDNFIEGSRIDCFVNVSKEEILQQQQQQQQQQRDHHKHNSIGRRNKEEIFGLIWSSKAAEWIRIECRIIGQLLGSVPQFRSFYYFFLLLNIITLYY